MDISETGWNYESPVIIGEFTGSDNDGNTILSSIPIVLSSMVKFYWSQFGSDLGYRLDNCWAAKTSGTSILDSEIVRVK